MLFVQSDRRHHLMALNQIDQGVRKEIVIKTAVITLVGLTALAVSVLIYKCMNFQGFNGLPTNRSCDPELCKNSQFSVAHRLGFAADGSCVCPED